MLHTVIANSSERLLKLHSHTGLCFGVPCRCCWRELLFWYFYKKISSLRLVTYWSESFHLLQALEAWTLNCCLLSSWQQVEIYISPLHASKTPSSLGFISGWHFSCHAIQFGLKWGWEDSPPPAAHLLKTYHHSPQLESLTSRAWHRVASLYRVGKMLLWMWRYFLLIAMFGLVLKSLEMWLEMV